MEKAFEDILKGSVWENNSEYLYRFLHRLKLDVDVYKNEAPICKSLQYKIDLCNSIITCSTTRRVKIGSIELTKEQSVLAKNAIKEILIEKYYNLRMDENLISDEETYSLFYAGCADDFLHGYYQSKYFGYVHNGFLYRYMDSDAAQAYISCLWKEYSNNPRGNWPTFSKEDMKHEMGFLKYVQSSLLKKGRPKNYATQNAVELFFERCFDVNEKAAYDHITCINDEKVWQLYHPHTNEEYLTIYRCLDYFGLISKDIKKTWENIPTKYQEKSYIKKFVTILKEKHPF